MLLIVPFPSRAPGASCGSQVCTDFIAIPPRAFRARPFLRRICSSSCRSLPAPRARRVRERRPRPSAGSLPARAGRARSAAGYAPHRAVPSPRAGRVLRQPGVYGFHRNPSPRVLGAPIPPPDMLLIVPFPPCAPGAFCGSQVCTDFIAFPPARRARPFRRRICSSSCRSLPAPRARSAAARCVRISSQSLPARRARPFRRRICSSSCRSLPAPRARPAAARCVRISSQSLPARRARPFRRRICSSSSRSLPAPPGASCGSQVCTDFIAFPPRAPGASCGSQVCTDFIAFPSRAPGASSPPPDMLLIVPFPPRAPGASCGSQVCTDFIAIPPARRARPVRRRICSSSSRSLPRAGRIRTLLRAWTAAPAAIPAGARAPGVSRGKIVRRGRTHWGPSGRTLPLHRSARPAHMEGACLSASFHPPAGTAVHGHPPAAPPHKTSPPRKKSGPAARQPPALHHRRAAPKSPTKRRPAAILRSMFLPIPLHGEGIRRRAQSARSMATIRAAAPLSVSPPAGPARGGRNRRRAYHMAGKRGPAAMPAQPPPHIAGQAATIRAAALLTVSRACRSRAWRAQSPPRMPYGGKGERPAQAGRSSLRASRGRRQPSGQRPVDRQPACRSLLAHGGRNRRRACHMAGRGERPAQAGRSSLRTSRVRRQPSGQRPRCPSARLPVPRVAGAIAAAHAIWREGGAPRAGRTEFPPRNRAAAQTRGRRANSRNWGLQKRAARGRIAPFEF